MPVDGHREIGHCFPFACRCRQARWNNGDVPGGTGHPRSRELVTAIVWRLVAINAVASALGQVYSDLLRSAKARSIVFPHTAVVVAGACAFAVLLLFSTRRARPVVGSEFSPRGAAITGVIFLGVLGVSAWFSHPGQFAHRSRLEIVLIDLPAAMIWVAAVGVGALRRAQRVFGPQLHWLDAGVAPSDEERTALVRMPSAIALFYLPYWAALGVLNFVGDSLTPRLGGAIGADVL